ncbi:MAG: hypothetical protein COB34_04215 [Methylophilaceae bacterium]|nr:MAG: hypothetical protein COB34_04215 [Methylophilaceae bacterium]
MTVFKTISTIATLLFSTFLFSTFSFAAESGAFGDHCTYGLSRGAFNKTNCEINEIYKGQKYCFSAESSKDSFLFDPDTTIEKAKILCNSCIETSPAQSELSIDFTSNGQAINKTLDILMDEPLKFHRYHD